MKKYWSLLVVISFLIVSCMVDESEYTIQEKEDVIVDEVNVDTTSTEEELPEGQLVPGIHEVFMKVPVTEGSKDSVERRFKYYMPISIDATKPISLLFEFHGSNSFTGTPTSPIAGISEDSQLNQKALEENFIVCYPAGEVIYTTDTSGVINWQNAENHLTFVDAMVKYFTEDNEPRIDPNRIYSTGQSSGALFSFALALHRSEVIAAITPRAGQSRSTEPFPSRAVPVRVFAGVKDGTVQHSAVLTNMTRWAEEIGGYFSSDMQMDTTVYNDYSDVTIRYWHGGKADYEIYSLEEIDHNIGLVTELVNDMFDFMLTHTLDNATTNLYVTTSIKDINVQCGEPISFDISYTEGAQIGMVNAPKGWNAQLDLENNKVTMRAPSNYFGAIDREGSITFTVSSGSHEPVSCEVTYYLNAPKAYFEVGDIYYNEDYVAEGVVVWVDQNDIRRAKIVNINEQANMYYNPGSKKNCPGLGFHFETPDKDDGLGNTQKMWEENASREIP